MKPIADMSEPELLEAIWRMKRLIHNLGKLVKGRAGREFVRASGLAVCPDCGLEYYDHPVVDDALLHVACSGKLLKL